MNFPAWTIKGTLRDSDDNCQLRVVDIAPVKLARECDSSTLSLSIIWQPIKASDSMTHSPPCAELRPTIIQENLRNKSTFRSNNIPQHVPLSIAIQNNQA